jgi:hypothetical protein
MKEHPILFSTPMVQANSDGRKTNTRRMTGLDEINGIPDDWFFLGISIDNTVFEIGKPAKQLKGLYASFYNQQTNTTKYIKCPYGQSGDLLWVRETWINTFIPHCVPVGGFYYKADHPQEKNLRWKPSIHMPKAIARIWLQVVEIRVERLQNISDEDAIAEGVEISESGYYKIYDKKPQNQAWTDSPKVSFMSLFQSINGEEIWKQNPWVWVVKYKVLSTSGKPDSIPQ